MLCSMINDRTVLQNTISWKDRGIFSVTAMNNYGSTRRGILNTYHAVSWADDSSLKNVIKKSTNSKRLTFTTQSWNHHGYKHTQYWFSKSWNRFWDLRIWRKQILVCMVELLAGYALIVNVWSEWRVYHWQTYLYYIVFRSDSSLSYFLFNHFHKL